VRVVAVVVNWNGGEDNLACLRSLLGQTGPPAEIVFVDNGSSDGSAELVAERFPDVRVLRNAENLGFGGASNQGIALGLERGADAAFLVNNDVELPPDTLAQLVEALGREPGVGIVGPRVLYRDEPHRIWAAGGVLTWRRNLTTLCGHGGADHPRWQRTRRVDYVPGCAMLVRREVFERVGLFDPEYFMYTEDVDFCLGASRAGFASLCEGRAAAHHAASTSTGGGYNPRRKYMMGVNSIWFLRRYAGAPQWASFVLFDVLTLPFAWLLGLPFGRGRSVLAKALGIVDGLRGRRVTGDQLGKGGTILW